MSSKVVTKGELQPGDVLLCKIPRLSYSEYLSSIVDVIRGSRSKGAFEWDAAGPLIHWLIGCLDEGEYFHAAFWDGSGLVQSRIKSGLAWAEVETFAQDTVDVYRFHKDGQWLGSPGLPVAPLKDKAEELLERHLSYGFDNAKLLAILCVTRWPREHLFERLRDVIVRYAPVDVQESLGKTLDALRPQIDWLIEKILVFVLNVANDYLKGKGYVCSQTVAVIYNEAGDAEHPVGTYRIPKPDHAARPARLLLAAPRATRQEVAACEQQIRQLSAELGKLPARPARLLTASGPSMYDKVRELLTSDNYYTPGDLAKSTAMEQVGELKLEPARLGVARGSRGAMGKIRRPKTENRKKGESRKTKEPRHRGTETDRKTRK